MEPRDVEIREISSIGLRQVSARGHTLAHAAGTAWETPQCTTRVLDRYCRQRTQCQWRLRALLLGVIWHCSCPPVRVPRTKSDRVRVDNRMKSDKCGVNR